MSQSNANEDHGASGLSRRDLLQTAGIATLASGSGAMSLIPNTAQGRQSSRGRTEPGEPIKPKQYNVLFILTDQERYLPELLGKGHWPGRDRLAKMGTTFENHQVCSMVCTPSRSVIFTGQHIQHTGMFDNTDKPGRDVQGAKPTMFEITRDPDDRIYKKKWGLPLSPSRKQPWDKPGRPKAHYDYQKSMAMLTGFIPNEDKRWRKMQEYYLNCISDNDRSVDTILTELENLGMLENTIVMLTADHGELCGAHGMSGKGATAFREQNNVPFIVYHPDVPGGRKCKAVTAHNDIVPTILAMTGADKKQKKKVADRLHGRDVSPLLEDPQKAAFDSIRDGALYCFSMWAFMDADWLQKIGKAAASGEKFTLDTMPRPDMKKRSNIRTVFDGRYKYSRYFNSQQHNRPTTVEEIFEVNDVELFHLKNDPHEMNNLARDGKKRDVLLAMNDKLNRLIDTEVGTDDGSHLPDIAGVDCAFERFDP